MNSEKKFETREQLLHRLQEGISFEDGEEYTPVSYQNHAAELTAKWKAAHYSTDDDESDSVASECSPKPNKPMTAESLEQDYWNIVETQRCSMA